MQDPCVVHEDVDATKRTEGPFSECRCVLLPDHIGLHRQCPAPRPFDLFYDSCRLGFGGPVGDCDIGPSCARRSAIARPRPRLPPVTSATRSSSLFMASHPFGVSEPRSPGVRCLRHQRPWSVELSKGEDLAFGTAGPVGGRHE